MLRYVLLGLLEAEPRYGYELKAVFEQFLGGTWSLNIGQVYTALAKLEREGLVECQVVPQDLLPDRKVYAATGAGRAELEAWTEQADDGPVRMREGLFLKVAIAALADDERAGVLIRRQREHAMTKLAQLGRLQHDPGLHPATALILEGAMLRLEADLRWLDVCAERLKGVGS